MDDAKRSRMNGVPEPKPKYPQYAVPARRAESFKSWPEYLPQRPDKLIEAGLVYTGVGDSVRCYHCGGGLRSWEEEDDPWVEHAKWYPWCPHVLLAKGQTFVDKVGRGENPYEQTVKEDELIKKAGEKNWSAVAMESCIQMGYPESVVKAAADVFKKRHGHDNFRGEDLCEIIFKIEETEGFQKYVEAYSKETEQNAQSATGNSAVDVSTTRASDVTKHGASSETNGMVENGELGDETTRSEDLQKLQEENQRLKDSHQCKICMDAIADIIFLPCGHMISCAQCAPAMSKCPVCRETIKSRFKAFLA